VGPWKRDDFSTTAHALPNRH
jgi:hypothetical protein